MAINIEATKDNANTILVIAETKRIAENLTKKEMCHVLGINDNYYIGCIAGRVVPSVLMLESLLEYINMNTKDVYFKVFAFRSSPVFISNRKQGKFMTFGNNVFKEKYHDKMAHFEPEFATIVEQLEKSEVLRVPM